MQSQVDGDYDAIIVGTGPGGGSVANELSTKGWKLLILEKGHGEPINGTFGQLVKTALVPGKSMHFTQQFLGLMHGITLGGSTIPYYATAFDPPYEMFDKHSIDLRPEVEELYQELPIAPLADELLGPAAKQITKSAQELGYDWIKLPKIVYQQKCRLNCDKCTLGCPYGAKWTSRMLIQKVTQNGNTLLTGADVKSVIHDNQVARGVEYVYQGRRHRAYGSKVIVSAGGMGSPALLRRSGLSNVGTNFFFDPLIIVFGEVAGLDSGKEFPMAAGCQFHEDGYMLADLVLPRPLFWLFTTQVLRLDRLAAHKNLLPIMIKVRDELGGHLTTGGGVRKRLGQSEKRRLMVGYEHARKILANAGARKIYRTWYIAVHPGGTVKIGEVVDSNLETQIDNLYVCDCSVIPEAWGQPPTLAILALGKRLGRSLAA